MYAALADAVVFLHVLYVAYVVLGQAVVVAAGTFHTRWGRNPWFRWSHLLAIAVVVLEEAMGWTCPLTTWEQYFRHLAGQPWGGDTFVSRLTHALIYNYDWPPVLFTAVHVAFGVVVAQAFLMYPPRGFTPRRSLPSAP